MNVLFVHGFWDTGCVFRRLRKKLEAAGHTCYSPTLNPRDGRHGLDDLARKLATYVETELKEVQPLAVVGFSMGCLVSRYYLQRLRGERRIAAFFAISGPLHGTAMAYLYPGQGARDMRFRSQFLQELDATAAGLAGIPLHTYYTPYDAMILPQTSSRLAGATELKVNAWLHPLMLTHPAVGHDLITKLNQLEA